jgi:heme oxygenase
MLIRLAQQTRAHHAHADADRLALMDVFSELEYRSFLSRVYGFEAAVAQAMACVPELERHGSTARTKVERLHADLVALGLGVDEVAALPKCTLVSVRTPAQALGWLFVVERSTLLAGLIRRYLVGRLPELISVASGYLSASGDRAGERFRELGDLLGRCAQRGIARPDAVAVAAAFAFQTQHRWYARGARLRASSIPPPIVAQSTTPLPRSPTGDPAEPRDAA